MERAYILATGQVCMYQRVRAYMLDLFGLDTYTNLTCRMAISIFSPRVRAIEIY